ncbi:hypothetical protein QFZ94_007017 [Paraburkholderia sp. JPY465]
MTEPINRMIIGPILAGTGGLPQTEMQLANLRLLSVEKSPFEMSPGWHA